MQKYVLFPLFARVLPYEPPKSPDFLDLCHPGHVLEMSISHGFVLGLSDFSELSEFSELSISFGEFRQF